MSASPSSFVRGAYRAEDKVLTAWIPRSTRSSATCDIYRENGGGPLGWGPLNNQPHIHLMLHVSLCDMKPGFQVSRCAYHGWEFDSGGGCTKIPQVEDSFFLAGGFFLDMILSNSPLRA